MGKIHCKRGIRRHSDFANKIRSYFTTVDDVFNADLSRKGFYINSLQDTLKTVIPLQLPGSTLIRCYSEVPLGKRRADIILYIPMFSIIAIEFKTTESFKYRTKKMRLYKSHKQLSETYCNLRKTIATQNALEIRPEATFEVSAYSLLVTKFYGKCRELKNKTDIYQSGSMPCSKYIDRTFSKLEMDGRFHRRYHAQAQIRRRQQSWMKQMSIDDFSRMKKTKI